jgi:hypothetical protein
MPFPFLLLPMARPRVQPLAWGAILEEDDMALDVYFREDILNVLRATYVASEGPATLAVELLQDGDLRGVPLEKLLQIYRRGFHTALAAVGLAFGLVPSEPVGQSLVRTQTTAAAPSAVEAGLHELDLIGFLWAKAQVEKRQR